jgi:aminopeptidase N
MHRKFISAVIIGLMAPMVAPMASTGIATTTQLPRTVRPTHYDVAIFPDAASLTFSGRVAIAIEVLQPTASITLNAAALSFANVSLSGGPGSAAFAKPQVRLDEAAETATFSFDHSIPKGNYRLSIDYTGRIATQAAGMFAIDYDTAAGRKRALYTQFENSDARRVIPSWDEPSYKATFALEAVIPSDEMAVSNTPIAQKTDLGGGRSRVRFEPSPKMSTYLLFFALGDFERSTARVGGTELGVITRKGMTSQALFALESSQLILREYNDYFAIPYPLAKLDNIAAPGRSQFFGAMENWGAIFTFEFAMLIDPSFATQIDTERAFAMAAHETSHQWFGDLVTMRWWDDLWLNEGFANWMESRTTARLHPEWNTALLTVAGRERAMGRDALATTHPIVQHIETVEQASQAFDDITYDKGEAVIGMLEAYVGADAWRAGVRRYLKAHAYGNTVSDDLWKEIEAAAGKPVAMIAHDFTLQPGVPMIRVEDAACAAGRTTLRLTQGEFSKDQPHKAPLAWRVPVVVRPLGAAAPVRKLLTGGKATLTVPGCAPVIVNAGQKGYYRTLNAPWQFAAIVQSFASVAPIDQLGILSDSWSLGLAGLQPATDFLDLAAATTAGADPQIWGKIAAVFDSINDYYDGYAARQAAFRKFAIARLAPLFAQIGWAARPGELSATAILRNRLIDTLSALGDPAVIAEARRRYAAQAADPAAVPAPLRKTILGVVARHADAATWDQLHAAALAEKTPLIKTQLYLLLASTEDESLARRALELALTTEPGTTTTAAMFGSAAELHADLAFDYGIAHLAAVMERVDLPSRSRFFAALAARSADPAMIGKIKRFAVANLAAGSRRDADTAAADVAYRIKVRTERLPALDAWLARN